MDFGKIIKSLHLERLKPFLYDPPKRIKFTGLDVMNIIIIGICSFWVRLWKFHYPPNVVFDEIHFGNFTNFYLKHEYFFDIHPPLAKFLFAIFASLSEYDASIPFSKIFGKEYPSENYVPLRITPVMFSSLTPLCIYTAVRFVPFSRIAAFTSAMLFCFDTSAICEGRFILTDGTLHFFVALSMTLTNIWLSFPRDSKEYYIWQWIASFGLGCAFSVKYTALSLCMVVGVTQLVDLLLDSNFEINAEMYSKLCVRALWIAGPAFSFHFLLWIIHVVNLPFIGWEYSDGDKPLLKLVNGSDPNCTDYSQVVRWPPIFARALSIVMSIQVSNALNYQPHPYMSRPIDWPLLTDVWVGFWSENGHDINCVGNVFVYYIGFLGVLLMGAAFKKDHWIKAARFFMGYWFSYLPFFGVPRTMFLYHYLIPLMFACMCFGVCLDFWCSRSVKGFVCVIAISLAVFGYYEWSPLVYGTPTQNLYKRVWNRAWMHGRKGREKFVKYMQSKYELVEKLEKTPTPKLRNK